MANNVKNVNGITIGNIKNINGITDANLKNLNGEEFTGTVALAVTSLDSQLSGNSTRHWGLSQAYDSVNNQVIFCYGDNNNSDYGTCIVMAADKSHGSAVVFSNSGSTYHTGAVFNTECHSDGRLMVAYHTTSGSNDYRIIGGTMGTKTVTFATGGHTVVDAGSNGANQADGTDICAYDPTANVAFVAIENGGDSGHNYVHACTIDTSDDSITVGAGQEFVATTIERMQLTYDPDIGKTVLIYDNGTEISARVISAVAEDLGITLGSASDYSVSSDPAGGGQNQGTWAVYDTGNNTHHVFLHDGSDYVLNYFTVSGTTVTWAATAKEQVAQSTTNRCRGVLYQHNRNKLMTYGHTSSGTGNLEFDIYTFDGTDYTHDSTTGSTNIEASFGDGCHTLNASMDGVDHSSFGYGLVFSYCPDLGSSGGHLRAVGVELGG